MGDGLVNELTEKFEVFLALAAEENPRLGDVLKECLDHEGVEPIIPLLLSGLPQEIEVEIKVLPDVR